MKRKNILILAPHPDDEFLNCSSILSRSRDVSVIYATNGDFTGKAATETRYRESLAAMRMVGLGPGEMIYLGYGDRGGNRESSFLAALLDAALDTTPLASSVGAHTYGPREHPEYHFRRYGTHAPYTRRSFLDDLSDLFCQLRPHAVFLPSLLDYHWDHRGLNMLAHQALERLPVSPICFTYLTHYGSDRDWPNRKGPDFQIPCGFPPDQWSSRIEMPVSVSQKAKLLEQFSSQRSGDGYLEAFCKRQEVYWYESMEAGHGEQDVIDSLLSG